MWFRNELSSLVEVSLYFNGRTIFKQRIYHHSYCDSSSGFNTTKGHTKTDCTAILVRWNRDEMASKTTNKNRATELTYRKQKILSARKSTSKHNWRVWMEGTAIGLWPYHKTTLKTQQDTAADFVVAINETLKMLIVRSNKKTRQAVYV